MVSGNDSTQLIEAGIQFLPSEETLFQKPWIDIWKSWFPKERFADNSTLERPISSLLHGLLKRPRQQDIWGSLQNPGIPRITSPEAFKCHLRQR